MTAQGNGRLVTTTLGDLDTALPPHTAALQQSLEQWHLVHARNAALEKENERLKADNYVLTARCDWLEQECQRLTVVSDRYKSANVEIATALRCAAGIFNSAIQRAVDGEHAPAAELVPLAHRGDMTAEEAESSIRKIAERFGSGHAPQGDEKNSK